MQKNLKKALIVTATVATFTLGGGTTAYAFTSWQAGHDNLVAVSKNIDALTSKIKSLKNDQVTNTNTIADLRNQADDLRRQLKGVTDSKAQDAVKHQKELQEKIDEVNQKIAEGNTNVAKKQDEINKLNERLNESNKNISELEKALNDAQDLKNKSDDAVKEANK